MDKENLLKLAIRYDENNCASELLISIYAEYAEGGIDKSKDLFNKYIERASFRTLELIKENSPFEELQEVCVFWQLKSIDKNLGVQSLK